MNRTNLNLQQTVIDSHRLFCFLILVLGRLFQLTLFRQVLFEGFMPELQHYIILKIVR